MTGHVATASTEIEASPQRVWEAMTDPEQVGEYMLGSVVESDFRPGSPITWTGEWEGRPYQDRGRILRAEPGRLLELTHYSPLSGDADVPENHHRVSYELEASTTGTVVKVSQDGCRDAEQAAQFGEQWQQMLYGLKRVTERS